MIIIEKYTKSDQLKTKEQAELVQFFFEHLDIYGDSKEAITKCIDFVQNKNGNTAGLILLAKEEDEIIGAVVMNETGMQEYIPENILVYIAVHEKARGKGIGQRLMEAAKASVSGGIALHVEPDNPARKLYERLGFTNKYLEMRWQK
ncbi:MAG: GNAT family N-acetyltransferase [Crocinitomicaceae bacterium]|nr:GNAT family N-acetyltransferase [Crocinitomicaceae bacterium]